MLFRVSQFSILGLVLVWLAALTGLSSSAHSHPNHNLHTHHRRVGADDLTNYKSTDFNLHAHIYEKLFLWEAYQIFTQIQTPERQQLIFPFRDRKGPAGSSNRHIENGRKTDKAMNYVEFMLRTLDKAADLPLPPDITEPTSKDDLQRAEKELSVYRKYKYNFQGTVELSLISPNLALLENNAALFNSGRAPPGGGGDSGDGDAGSGSSDSNDAKKEDDKHIRYIRAVSEKVAAVKDDAHLVNIGDVSDRLGRAEEISFRIAALRKGQTSNWIVKELSSDQGWNLQEPDPDNAGKYRSTVVMAEADTQVPGMKTYQVVDFPRTLAVTANIAKIQGKGLNNWDKFMTWGQELGNRNAITDGPASTKRNVDHWEEIKPWESFWDKCAVPPI
ncbi:uncharacterized protein PGRI_048500 [Penicillium griseofulvum]|uniref:Uncharacterized protein n=1 Tax=Penicillium patulum TaxID=5078 RepID=A0A135LAN1_PENPA|nr:uncharacterized protein PGRI_048500 [Penicillium griseofulvum]KXG45994.1 hypothetical protein PGRI_048500 [Penicillium griseofulvum]